MRRTSHLSKLVIISPALQRFFPIYEHTKVAAKKWIWLRSHEKTMMAMGNMRTSDLSQTTACCGGVDVETSEVT